MKKIALTMLAVMAAVGVLVVQPADAKKVQQDPVVSPIEMPMNATTVWPSGRRTYR